MTSHSDQPARPELSRRIAVASVSDAGERFRIDATEDERRALARRFDLIDLPALHAEGVVTVMAHGRKARVEGRLRAQVVQSCVVTLEPVPAQVEQEFVRLYTADVGGTASVAAVDLDADDPPEPIVGGGIDLGEAVAEELGLGLDPYPRRPGADLEQEIKAADPASGSVTAGENRRESPFAALKGLVKKS